MPGIPHKLSGGGSCRVDSATSFMACPEGGNGSTPPEQFVPLRPDGGQTPIQPSEKVLLKSELTGLYCRVSTDPGTGRSQVLCDQPTAATATPLTYTGTGISYNGRPFINDGSGAVYFGNPGAAATGTSLQPVAPAPPTVTSGTAYNLNFGGTCYVESVDSYVKCYNSSSSGKTASEQFVVYTASLVAGALIAPGTTTLIRSVKTGLFCRTIALPTGSTQIQCDVADAAQASACSDTNRSCPSHAVASPTLIDEGARVTLFSAFDR
jgi:hypothetical protein